MSVEAALGFAPHSGWAAVVAVRLEEAGRPSILHRGRIEMADSSQPGSKQPYHAVEPLPLTEARRRLARFRASAARKAKVGLASVVAAVSSSSRGAEPLVAGLLEGSGRAVNDLASVLSSHALIHTADGEHFRTALQQACEAVAIEVVRVRRRELAARACRALEASEEELGSVLRRVGKPLGPPWGADEKSAALLAWLLLVERG